MGMDRNREAFRKRFQAYKDGKSVNEIYSDILPGYRDGKPKGDGMKYSWDDQTQSWDRYTGDTMGDTFADFVVTPRGGAHKKDTEPVQIVTTEQQQYSQRNKPTVSRDDNLYTRQQVEKANNTRTWRSDVADAMKYVQYGADAASLLYTPGLVPAIKNRAAKAIYRNIAPASYKESYLKGGKRAEVFNAFLDFVSPKTLTLTNDSYKKWMKEYALKDFETITPATSARDEIYRRYLGLPSSNLYYSPTQHTGVFTHNLYNTHYKDVLKQINHAAAKDPELSGKITTGIDYMNSAGGNISQKIKMLDSNNAVLQYEDVWDVNPFLDANRVGNVLPKKIINKYTHIERQPDGYEKLVWNDNTPWFINKLKNFELSSLTNGGPVPVKTDINLKVLYPKDFIKTIKPSDSEIIKKATDIEVQNWLMEADEFSNIDAALPKIEKEYFQKVTKAFIENPNRFRSIFTREIPINDTDLYNKYGYFIRKLRTPNNITE